MVQYRYEVGWEYNSVGCSVDNFKKKLDAFNFAEKFKSKNNDLDVYVFDRMAHKNNQNTWYIHIPNLKS